jgi:probable F420-dependent oxidoreductase
MAAKAEQMGFDSVWVTDHIIVPHVIPDRPDIVYRYNMLEPLALLTHLGAVTRRVNIGTSVIILPYRNPVVLAKTIATADVLSRGRVIFGAAIGWMEGEFQALQAPFANRGQVSDEYLRLLKELWTNPTPAFQGEYFQFSDVTFSPMPVQQPHPPIWIGGRSLAGVRRAVQYGDYWHPSQLGPEEVARKARYMRRYSASLGRETPPQLSWRGTLSFSGAATSEERPPLHGTTEDIIADVQEYAQAGVSHMIMEIAGDTYGDKFRAMERFLEEVKPRVPA